MRWIGIAAALIASPAAANMDSLAEDYVRLVLEYGTHEDGYVDAYYGPKAWRTEAEATPRSLAELAREAERLKLGVQSEAWPSDPLEQKRRRFLAAQIDAVGARIAMQQGKDFSFTQEARALFAAEPELRPLESFDPIIAEIETMIPGDGPLGDRVEAFRDRYRIPDDRLEAVMRAAIDECKARTAEHIDLPEGERFTLSFVTDKPWSGYNWYQGEAHSLIEVNTDLPINISRAVDLGCHEGYPGHHTLNALLEAELVDARGWREFSVYPLFSPQSLIAEGSANAGIEMAFPGEERTKFEAETLYPLAGLDPATAPALAALNEATEALYPARYTIADAYLGGRMSREEAIANLQRYQLVSAARAAQTLDFIDTYRSYIINYGLGREMVEDYVDAAGESEDARWTAFEAVISEPTLPSDLNPLP